MLNVLYSVKVFSAHSAVFIVCTDLCFHWFVSVHWSPSLTLSL